MSVLRFALIPMLMGSALLYGSEDKASTEVGESLYRHRCGGCHGLDGKANTSIGKQEQMRDLTSPEVQKQSDAELTRVIANGQGRMPSYALILGDERIRAVIGYIRELGRK